MKNRMKSNEILKRCFKEESLPSKVQDISQNVLTSDSLYRHTSWVKNSPHLKGHCSLDISAVKFASISLNCEHVHIYFKIILTEIGHNFLKSWGIFQESHFNKSYNQAQNHDEISCLIASNSTCYLVLHAGVIAWGGWTCHNTIIYLPKRIACDNMCWSHCCNAEILGQFGRIFRHVS